jgi:hypothetical protein
MLDALGNDRHALAGVLELGVVGADLLDEAPITGRTGVGDDDVVIGALLSAGAGETELE